MIMTDALWLAVDVITVWIYLCNTNLQVIKYYKQMSISSCVGLTYINECEKGYFCCHGGHVCFWSVVKRLNYMEKLTFIQVTLWWMNTVGEYCC